MKKVISLLLLMLSPSIAFAALQLENSSEVTYTKNATAFTLHLPQFNMGTPSSGQYLQYNSSQSKWTPVTLSVPYTSVTGLTTANVSEVTNLYYTTARARGEFNATDPITLSSGIIGFNTSLKSAYDSAVGWGDHASAGYATESNLSTHNSTVIHITSGNRTQWDAVYANNHTAFSANQATNTTSNVTFNQVNISDVAYFNLTPSTNGTTQEGKLYWDANYKTLSLNSANDTNLQIGQETWIRVVATEDILNGQAVYLSGASGVFPTGSLANASSLTTSYVAGLATHNITNGTEGFIVCPGVVHDINTSAWSSGDNLYLSPTDSGNLTNVIPVAPDIVNRVGRVVVSNDTVGSIYSNPTMLTNVIQSASSGAGNRVWYLNDTEGDISGYGILNNYPVSGTEEFDNKTVSANQTLIESYATAATGFGHSQFEGGNWQFDIYANTSSILNSGTTTIKVYVYRRAGESETELFNVSTPDLTSTTITLYSVKTTQATFAANTTDRIVVKYYANTTKTSARSVGFVHGGTTRYTTITTPFPIYHDNMAGLKGDGTGGYFHLNSTEINGTFGGRNVTANYFVGNGSLLTGIAAGGASNPVWINGTSNYSKIEKYTNQTLDIQNQVFLPPSNLSLLINCDGAEGGTTVEDTSGQLVTVSLNGDSNTTQTTKKFGNASATFNGAGYLNVSNSTMWNFAQGDFTIDCWVNATNLGTAQYIWSMDMKSSPANYDHFSLLLADGTNIMVIDPAENVTTVTSGIAANTWTHVATVKNGDNLRLYVNGNYIINRDVTGLWWNHTGSGFIFGAFRSAAANFFEGRIDEIRVSDQALWTSNFTVPSAATNPTGTYPARIVVSNNNTTSTFGNADQATLIKGSSLTFSPTIAAKDVNGTMKAGAALCWKSNTTFGYCSNDTAADCNCQ